MAKFPEPPSAEDLANVSPVVRVLPAGKWLWRLYFRGGGHPTFWNTFRAFGPTGGRFDHQIPPPRVQVRQMFYCAEEGATCLAEVFQDARTIDRASRDPWLVGFELRQPVSLLDLTGAWPTRAGASLALSTGPRSRAQRWSRAFYQAYPNVQGVIYPSSMHGAHSAVALYERAAGALPAAPVFHRPLIDPGLLSVLAWVAQDLGYGLL